MIGCAGAAQHREEMWLDICMHATKPTCRRELLSLPGLPLSVAPDACKLLLVMHQPAPLSGLTSPVGRPLIGPPESDIRFVQLTACKIHVLALAPMDTEDPCRSDKLIAIRHGSG